MIYFAATVLGKPLDPWQQWLVIHAGELLEDGRPRFRQVLVIVARQNGKTHLCTILALFWLYVERWPLVFGTSNKLDYAKDSWEAAMNLALETPTLAARTRKPRVGNGQQDLPTTDRCHYRIGAANEDGGRSKSIDRAIGDELRQQRDWTAYLAMMPALNARPHGQVVFITNMGDSRSVVLNSLRSDALDAIAAGGTLERPVFLAEWSALPGAHPMDRAAWAAANPQLGRRMDPDVIEQAARRVAKPGADLEELNGFLTEILCLGVDQLDPAFDPGGWGRCEDRGPLDVAARRTIAACVDVSPDLQHATLAAAQLLEDGRVRVETLMEWNGAQTLATLRTELPAWVVKVRPRALGWYPGGPAATLDAELRDRRKVGRYAWPPRGVDVAELKADTPAVVMGFAALVAAVGVAHSGQAMLTAQLEKAEKKEVPGDRWVITRRGAGGVDAVYAVAGAAHLARTLPQARPVSRRAQSAPAP